MSRLGSLRILHEASAHSRIKGMTKWSLGAGLDGSRHGNRLIKPGKAGVSLIHFASLVRALSLPSSAAELCRDTGISLNIMRRQLLAMRSANIAFRSEWHRERVNSDWTPYWQFGIDKKDAPKPRAKTEKELRTSYNSVRRERANNTRIVRALSARASIFNMAST